MTTNEDLEDTSAPLMEHLIELRQRLMKAIIAILILFLICFYFASEILDFLIIPYKWGSGVENPELFFTALQEVFFVEVRIAFFGAVFIGFPIIASQLYKFIAPGLYNNEKGAFLPFLIATPVLFFLGGCLVYFFVMPSAVYFFLSFQREAIEAALSIIALYEVSIIIGRSIEKNRKEREDSEESDNTDVVSS